MKKKNPVVHFEMPADDRQRMADFYSKAFGWETRMMGEEMGNYVLVSTCDSDANGTPKNPANINGGFYPRTKDAPQTSIVIAVNDIKESMDSITKAGGKLLGEPVQIPGVGFYVSFLDTEGNRSSILQPTMNQG